MSAIYFAIPTDAGQAKIANALALGVPLKITHMAVGDGNGKPVTPNAAQTALARVIRPSHTYWDGDSAFVLSSAVLPEADPLLLGALVQDAVALAVADAVLSQRE